MESRKITRERKSGVVTIKQAVIRISSVTIRSQKDGKNQKWKAEKIKNGVACTIARVIQIKNVFSRGIVVNVRTVLLLMVEIAENMKPL